MTFRKFKKCHKSPDQAGLQKPPRIKSKLKLSKNFLKQTNCAWKINSLKPFKSKSLQFYSRPEVQPEIKLDINRFYFSVEFNAQVMVRTQVQLISIDLETDCVCKDTSKALKI